MYDQAISLYSDILTGSLQTDVYIDRGDAYLAVGKYEEAIADFTTSIHYLNADDTLIESLLYRALQGRIKALSALELYEEARFDHWYLLQIQSGRFSFSKPSSSLIIRCSYTESEIEREREIARKEIGAMNDHIYDMGRESLNGQLGDAVHHGIQAGSHGVEAYRHNREAKRMERENERENESDYDGWGTMRSWN